MSFLNYLTKRTSQSKVDRVEIEDSVINALIEVCYSFDTTSYIESFEKANLRNLCQHDRKALDPVLSCLSLGIAIRFLSNKYGEKSVNLSQKIYNRIYSTAKSVSPEEDSEEIAKFYTGLIKEYTKILDYDAVDAADYGLGVCEKVFEPLEGFFEDIRPSPSISLFVMQFINEFGAKTKGIIEKAEEQYNFLPTA